MQGLELSNEGYDVASLRRSENEMCVIRHQAVHVDWHSGLVCMLVEHVACRPCDLWVCEDRVSLTYADCHGANRARLTIKLSLQTNTLVEAIIGESIGNHAVYSTGLRGASPRATPGFRFDLVSGVLFLPRAKSGGQAPALLKISARKATLCHSHIQPSQPPSPIPAPQRLCSSPRWLWGWSGSGQARS